MLTAYCLHNFRIQFRLKRQTMLLLYSKNLYEYNFLLIDNYFPRKALVES